MRHLKLVARAAGGLALLAGVVWLVGPAAFARSLSQTDYQWFGLALALAICANVASSLRWAYIARGLGLRAPTSALMPMYARGITSNTVLPGATLSGDMLRTFELTRLGNPAVESAVSVAFDRFSGLWTLCVLSALAAVIAWAGGYESGVQADAAQVLLAYGLLMGGIVLAPFLPWPIEWIRRLPGRLGARLADLWQRLHDPGSGIKRHLVRSLVGSLLVQVLSALALVACARSLGVGLPTLPLLAASAPIFVMGALPLGVAGFGTRELAAVAVLGALGVSTDLAAGTGLLYGLCAVIMGILAAPSFLFSGVRQ